jgi:hypothetical protein
MRRSDVVPVSHETEDRLATRADTKLSEDAFRQVWDNPDDAEYDRLQVR